jgi:DNA replication initiation complex subunit (GINS family)
MKIGELRDKLEKYSKKELIKIAAEFYKQLPKAKKEALKDVIENPSAKPAPVLKARLSLTDIKT